MLVQCVSRLALVSIRSRRLSAGECLRPHVDSRARQRFNPLPPTVGGRIRRVWSGSRRTPFQSAPADCRRENACGCKSGPGGLRFNPLPPTVGGRMDAVRAYRPVGARFNPLPPTVGGRMSAARKPGDDAFQSAPADCRRENLAPAIVTMSPRFNPLPPTVGGRMWPVGRAVPGSFNPLPPTVGGRMSHGYVARGRLVSIRSRRLSAGECRTIGCRRRQADGFNPLPPTVGGRM